MSEEPVILQVLRALSTGENDLVSLKSMIAFRGQILPTLLWLHSMNFITRKEVTHRNPVIRAKWSINESGRNYLSYVDSHKEFVPFSPPMVQVLLVAPEKIRNQVKATATDLPEALNDIFASATEEVLISSPYIDEVIVPLVRSIRRNCRIHILTENADKPLFTRLVESTPNLEVRVLKEVTAERVQLFQVHAKFVIVDQSSAIVTSANLNERSLYYNVEIGVLISDKETCKDMADVFQAIFESASLVR